MDQTLDTPKTYPISQIYAALTQIITDNTEYISDIYGRTGYLINIGDYYLFQPSELNYKNISIYERSVPIDYKHSMINLQVNQDIIKPVIDIKNIAPLAVNKSSDNGRSKLKAYSYLSLVDGELQKHNTWADCENRVRGVKGAKYRKSISPEDEMQIIKDWNISQ